MHTIWLSKRLQLFVYFKFAGIYTVPSRIPIDRTQQNPNSHESIEFNSCGLHLFAKSSRTDHGSIPRDCNSD
jgi:hypothetical protein